MVWRQNGSLLLSPKLDLERISSVFADCKDYALPPSYGNGCGNDCDNGCGNDCGNDCKDNAPLPSCGNGPPPGIDFMIQHSDSSLFRCKHEGNEKKISS